MTLLINSEIEEHLGDAIIISPFHIGQLNTNSYDLTIGPWIARYEAHVYPNDVERCLHLATEIAPFKLEYCTDEIVLARGERILAHSMEFAGGRVAKNTTYPCAVTTSLRATSTAGRHALTACQCAGLGDVGYINRWTFEVQNHGRNTVSFPVGSIIAQLEFHEVSVPEDDTLYGKHGRGNYQASERLEDIVTAWRPEQMLPKRLKVAAWVHDCLELPRCDEDF